MCRWAAYLGKPIFLEEVITKPAHSLIIQSHDATKAKTAINADGFGIAWYGERDEPGLYRDIYPAWSDPNLRALAHQVRSGLFLAHVRASTGTATSRNNCHPFTHGKWSFMHNGQVGGFEQFRKRADMAVPDALYASRKGATDSEVLFLLMLGAMEETGQGDPAAALAASVRQMRGLSQQFGTTPHMRLSSAFSDGESLWAARDSSDDIAPSVFYRWSESREGWAVVSEPLETTEGGWTELPPGHIAQFSPDGVEVNRLDT
ncbi:class II glutamine amidotransferase [Shimia biformata]|uniref:class II glutamine amidotransferase n=1 Tax=Shimia biformata TaxID=1294299 RepID=UPI00194EDF30|nr:class II glutamine amidotransferase [Shimia biformata]